MLTFLKSNTATLQVFTHYLISFLSNICVVSLLPSPPPSQINKTKQNNHTKVGKDLKPSLTLKFML